MKASPDYKYHPIADVFPLMSDAEIADLAEDIRVNGLTLPVILFQGKILDGRNRYLACQKVGVEPEFWEYPGDTPVQFVLSLNLQRRHLTISQRAAIAADVATLQDGQRADYAAAPNGAPVTQSEAADLLNVSHRTVQRAAAVRTADPDLSSAGQNWGNILGGCEAHYYNGAISQKPQTQDCASRGAKCQRDGVSEEGVG
jgi:ParB-like chromosome segregation protein Spo0J